MAKFKLILSIGFSGAEQEDIYEIDDETLVDMTAKEIEDELESALDAMRSDHIDTYWAVMESGDSTSGCRTTDEEYDKTKAILLDKGIDYA